MSGGESGWGWKVNDDGGWGGCLKTKRHNKNKK